MHEVLDRVLVSTEITADEPDIKKGKRRVLKLLAAAAAGLLIMTGGTLYFSGLFNGWGQHVAATLPTVVPDVQPGGNKAVLTLSGGQRIILNDAKQGQIAQQANANVVKIDSGLLAYKPQMTALSKNETPEFNTLATPRGGQYRLRLPDGTEVWLNAASSIRFPVNFSGNEREVEVRGEAYFEVARDPKRPFKVVMGQFKVDVLGTRFNINGYGDGIPIKTTLLEGSIQVSNGQARRLLKPRQQAQLQHDGTLQVIDGVNVDRVTAWKNGYFSFEKADLKTVMNNLSRWYNVEVQYEGKIPPLEFGGQIQRNLTLSQVLVILERSQVHFKMNGTVLTVTP